jgi:hypothetical protein
MMKPFYYIDGYWVDEGPEEGGFCDFIVSEYDEVLENEDVDNCIFFYGLEECEIINAIQTAEPVNLEFVITGYSKFSMCPLCGWKDYTKKAKECRLCNKESKEEEDEKSVC